MEHFNNSDTISRQAALDAFGLSEKTRKYGGDHSGYNTMMLYEIQNVIENLPSAQKKGTWVAEYDLFFAGHCSLCGWSASDIPYETSVFGMPYCPNCGARMESE